MRSETPITPPKILDQAPVSVDRECERWKPVSDTLNSGMKPCGNDAAVVFVYEASLDADDDRRRNCLACRECAPLSNDREAVPDGGQVRRDPPSDWLFLGLIASMTALAAAWGGLIASGAYFLAALLGTPVALSWYVLFKERDFA